MKKFLFALIALCMSISANAQFYDSSTVHFYIESGNSLTNSTEIIMFLFDGRNAKVTNMRFDIFKDKKLNESISACKNYLNREGTGSSLRYDSEFSTSARTTYSHDSYGVPVFNRGVWSSPVKGKIYYAFTNDKSEYIRFYIRKNTEDVEYKRYYQEIPFSELQPKGVNKDFLY